jgi:enterochelin esterase family protein
VLALAIAMLASASLAQDKPTAENHPRPRVDKAVFSPEVLKDRRVIFRFRAPNAKKVVLAREGVPRLAMTRDDQGTWSVTSEPLAPDWYSYNFIVDGVALADPGNPLQKPIATGGNESIVHVAGAATLVWEPRDVPHGILHRHTYHSGVVGEARDFWVYTPPGYDPAAETTYPVLYLLHGVMEVASAWNTVGQANVILDNLIADNKTRPMVIVMPLGYGFANVPDGMGQQFAGLATQKKLIEAFSRCLLDEVIPEVEKTYRVQKDREGRAVAGVSMGGTQALYIGLNHPDCFAWVGSFSGALIMMSPPFDAWFPALNGKRNQPPRLLWIACGTEDFLAGVNRKYKSWLESKHVAFTPIETPGGHTWPVWRRNLAEFAPLLFR